MKHFVSVVLTLVFVVAQSYARQEKFTRHTVAKSETVTQIAQKYSVTPYDIYRLNPDSQKGIHENDVILITASVQGTTAKAASLAPEQQTPKSGKTHEVKPKETLFSIARTYNVNVEDLKNANAALLKDGLKSGQIIRIPGQGNPAPETKTAASKPTETKPTEAKSGKVTYHTVAPGETKFAIAKKYGITVQELERQNPAIVPNLPAGYKLSIGGSGVKAEPVAEVEKPKPVKTEIQTVDKTETEVVKTVKKNGFANYEVKPKETLFSLTQQFDISQEELIALNPTLKDGVKTGMILKVPGKGSIIVEPRKGFEDLSKTVNKQDKKQLVLLFPFNASKIQGDTLKTISTRLKKEQFLNMTLDFYSGALMAIDSAKTLGMNIDVKIFDSEESRSSSNIAAIIKDNNLQQADAVIGPFYQQYVEKTAELLNKSNVPVISPLSKENGKTFSNLYQSMPSGDYAKTVMLDFMTAKGGNIIVVGDPKRMANKEFITSNYKNARFVEMNETGAFVPENLKALLVKDKLNYVVLDTEKTGMILSATTVLLNEIANYPSQIAIIEPNETLDFEEISMKRLTILKLLYPSFTRENNSPEAGIFASEYKKKNKIFPNQYATRGFDVTFDTMLRLSQGKSFEASAKEDKTEQVEGKFEYGKNGEGYANKGVYILQYQEDLSVKEAN